MTVIIRGAHSHQSGPGEGLLPGAEEGIVVYSVEDERVLETGLKATELQFNTMNHTARHRC